MRTPTSRPTWQGRISVRVSDGTIYDWIVELPTPTTLGEVASLVGLGATGPLIVDGHAAQRDDTPHDAGLVDGAVLAVGTGGTARARTGTGGVPVVLELRHTAGRGAGGRTPLVAGGHHVRRSVPLGPPSPAPSVPTHASFRVLVEADGRGVVSPDADRVRLDGATIRTPTPAADRTIRVGNDVFELSPPVEEAPGADAGGPWHRPPRAVAPPAPAAPTAPDAPRRPAPPPALSWILVLAPVPLAIVLALVLDPILLAVAGVGPVMMGARWWQGRRSHRREVEQHDVDLRAARSQVDQLLAGLRRDATLRWRQAHPDPARTVALATTADPTLWQRRGHHEDAGVVAVGTGAVPWTPEVAGLDVPAYADIAAAHAVLRGVPLTADLHRPLGLVGQRATTTAIARQVLAMLVTTHGPADVELAVVVRPDRTPCWDWLKWLPHLDGTRVCTDPASAAAVVRAWTAGDPDPVPGPASSAAPTRPLRVVLLDHPDALAETSGALRRALAANPDEPGSVSAVVLTDRRDELPASVATIVETAGDTTSTTSADAADVAGTTLTAPDGTTSAAVPRGLTPELAERVARSLARRTDPERDSGTGALPSRVRLTDLLPHAGVSRHDIAAAWEQAGDDPAPKTPIGVTADGPLWLDLDRDGPHALIAGTAGAGGSELLRSLVVGLAATSSPVHLNIVLIGDRGGGTFEACADLPHTVAVVTDLDEHVAAHALRSLQTEVRHRERVLRDADTADLVGQRRTDATPMPRLVVVVDEVATLARELPDVLDALVDIAQRGGPLGVHLVLATQRPAGLLDARVRAHTNLRVALRVQDESDALDVVGVADPALLPRGAVGRGYVQLGAGDVVALQTAWTGAVETASGPRSTVEPFQLAAPVADATGSRPDRAETCSDEPETGVGRSDLERLVATIADASELVGCPAPREICRTLSTPAQPVRRPTDAMTDPTEPTRPLAEQT